jgi:hypothetical protein
MDPRKGNEKLLKIFCKQNSKFSFVLYPNNPANGIINGLQRCFDQSFVTSVICDAADRAVIAATPIITSNIINNNAFEKDHNRCGADTSMLDVAESAIFLLTTNNQV